MLVNCITVTCSTHQGSRKKQKRMEKTQGNKQSPRVAGWPKSRGGNDRDYSEEKDDSQEKRFDT